jgi:hypothetical protein
MVYALYRNQASAQLAVDRLRAIGAGDREITVLSSEPFDGYELNHRDRQPWMYWIAGCGGAVGGAFAYWLTSMTQRAWPLPTGGMPIVAMWPNLVIIFELTMLGAILATVVTLLIAARLPRHRPDFYDPGIADGDILVGLEDRGTVPIEMVERALTVGDDVRIRTFTPPVR